MEFFNPDNTSSAGKWNSYELVSECAVRTSSLAYNAVFTLGSTYLSRSRVNNKEEDHMD